MISRTNAGGGSLSLTIKVHAVEPPEGQSGKENEIWVVSDTPSQYFAVKTLQPTASDWGLTDIPIGAIWVEYDVVSNAFNASKNKSLYLGVNPFTCHQYVDGGWVPLIAYMYRNGEWVQISNERMAITLYVDHVSNGRGISLNIKDISGNTITSAYLTSDGYITAKMTNNEYAFAHQGVQFKLVVTVRENPAPFFSAIMYRKGFEMSRFTGGYGSRSDYEWHVTSNGFM